MPRLTPRWRWRVNRRLGTLLTILLALLDALPAYWSAQAFSLNQRSTILLTVLLCVALAGAMWLLDLVSGEGHQFGLRALQVVLCGGFAGLFVLRLDYLQVAGDQSAGSATIQAVALTALLAALVVVGFVLLSHRVPKAAVGGMAVARRSGPAPDAPAPAADSAESAVDRW